MSNARQHSYRRVGERDLDSPSTETDALHLHHPPADEDDDDNNNDGGPTPTGELAGIYLGILNLFATMPQFISTFMSSIVFAILEPGKSPELSKGAPPPPPPDKQHPTDGPNAIAVCLFMGALAALGAAYATTRLRYVH